MNQSNEEELQETTGCNGFKYLLFRPDGLRKESIDVLPDFSEEMCVPLLMSGDMPIQDKFAYRDMVIVSLESAFKVIGLSQSRDRRPCLTLL